MGSLPSDRVVRAHALLGTAAEIIAQRRVVYQAPIELLGDEPGAAYDFDVLDHPMTRGHLADVISGRADLDTGAFRALSASGHPQPVAGFALRLAGSSAAPSMLRPAVQRVAVELARHGVDPIPPTVLTDDEVGFAVARHRLLDGVELAVRMAPGLSIDLLPHVALVALFHRRGTTRLGSASAREFPGLILLPEPESVLEAAEAFVHEGAHVKFFDLAITRSIFGQNQYLAPELVPSWRNSGQSTWPLEQIFAAFHAYCCLAVLWSALCSALWASPDTRTAVSGTSLLPVAPARAEELGAWLQAHTDYLGADGRLLLSALLGVGPDEPNGPLTAAPAGSEVTISGDFQRRVGDRTLVAQRGRPIQMLWHRGVSLVAEGD